MTHTTTGREAKARRRAEAEARNARPTQTLLCGHTTALDAETHAARCGRAA